MATSVLTFISLILLSMQGAFAQESSFEIAYRIREERELHTVGNLVIDAEMNEDYTEAEISSFVFSQLGSSDLNISVSSRGILTTTSRIDRDVLCPGSEDCIRVIDYTVQSDVAGSPAVIAFLRTRITINDINDITPKFPQDVHSLTITETPHVGRSWILPVATDNDSPENGINDYRLEPNNDDFELTIGRDGAVFDISLTQLRELDRESVAEYTLKVLALDPQNAGEMTLVVTIKDSNDNPPVFDSATYVAEMIENSPQSYTILTVRASDQDISENGQVVYSFDTNTQQAYGHLFAIDDDTGDIYVTGMVDYETATSYRLVVLAQDMGADSLQATTRVTINILDDNDSEPEVHVNALGGETGSARVSEGSPIGSFVAQVLVSDADDGENGRVTCSLNDNMFQLHQEPDENEYKIKTAAELDREQKNVYNLAIMCRDHGEEPMRALKQLTVNIDDVNDESPVFSSDAYTVSIAENSGGGAVLTTLSASDADLGINAQLTYSLSANVASNLYVTSTSSVAEIRTIRSFDREATPQIEFTVFVTDGGDPPLSGSTTVTVNIQDVNDERPVFELPEYVFEKEEEQLAFLPLGQIRATDPDSFPSNVITYSLAPQFLSVFNINPQSGELKSRERLDRETQAFYEIVAIATDNGTPPQSSSVTITLNLKDINDNEPIFQFPTDQNNTVYIANHYRIGTLITQVVATDSDAGAFGTVTYRLEQSPLREFSFDSSTGEVTLASDLSDVDYREYSLFISASDQDNPPRITYQTLHINVNKTLSKEGSQEVVEKPNETAVIAVACVAGTLITILGVGIACIVCRRRQVRSRKQQALKNAFVTISPQKQEYAHKQQCIHPHDCLHDVTYPSPLQSPNETDGILRKEEFNFQRSLSTHGTGIDNPALTVPSRASLNKSPLQDDHTDHERDTSSAEGSNADSGRGPSEEGESQSHISLQHILARRNSGPRLAPMAQFTDAHLGFETPGRRLLYHKTGSHTQLNQKQHSPQPPPIPPHEPFTTRSSGHLGYVHRSDRHSLRGEHDSSFASSVHRTSSYRADNPVKYLDGSCSKDVYV